MNDQEREWLHDQSLVLRAQLGDAQAFGDLVARWQDRLWRTARRMIGNDAAAWDVVQETWMAVVRGLSRLDNPRAFAAWAYRILAAAAAGWRRRNVRERRAQAQLRHQSQRGEAGDDPSHLDLQDELAEVLASLDADHLAVVSLYYGEAFSVAEVARLLGVPSGTVKSRLFHARRLLRERLGGDEHE